MFRNTQANEYLLTNIKNSNNIYLGYTALLTSANSGHLEVLKYLMSKGSSLQEKNNDGRNNN